MFVYVYIYRIYMCVYACIGVRVDLGLTTVGGSWGGPSLNATWSLYVYLQDHPQFPCVLAVGGRTLFKIQRGGG